MFISEMEGVLYKHYKDQEDILNALIDSAEARCEVMFGSEKNIGKVSKNRDEFIKVTMERISFKMRDPIIRKTRMLLVQEESIRTMDIHIQLADMKYIDSCIEILQNSDLGKAYFSNHKKAADMLTYAVGQYHVYVALDENEKCLGFIYYMTNGVFGSYPYLHIVAVKEEYRNYGIGRQLMEFFEDNASDSSSTKYFLTVDDFNQGAKILYENLGYKCVGELTDFYKKGINCYLMMKRRE